MPPTRRQQQPKEHCTHRECAGRPPFAPDSLKRHTDTVHGKIEVKKDPCYFCAATVTRNSRSSHMSDVHMPVYQKPQCPDCKISWTGSTKGVVHHRKCAVNLEHSSGFILSQVLGIYVRPEVKPESTYYYYEKAENADSSWTSTLNRQSFEDPQSRFKAFKLELDNFNGPSPGVAEAKPSEQRPMTATEELNLLFTPFPDDPDPRLIPHSAPSYQRSLSRPDISLRKATLYRIPI